jgi:pimeloyl-ACP methyl ester carboxylesterase/nitrite reductase/ring-hydroxylating ferredoxin subunit
VNETWERVCRVEDAASGAPVGAVVGDSGQDRDRVCVVRTEAGEHVALLDRCPHRDIALSRGTTTHDVLVCPGHFWRFALPSGRRTDRPDTGATVYPTRVVDGWVEALIPPVEPPQSMRAWLLAQARERTTMSMPDPHAADQAADPEIGDVVDAGGVRTNYHDVGSGPPVMLVHGSGPGVSAWANWRLTMPALAQRFRVLAPDVLGFGFTERPHGVRYNVDRWTEHLVAFLDALGLERVSLVGNSFGGALALSLATRHPQRVDKLVLMGSAGTTFELTPGLDQVWGFQPSLESMQSLLEVFTHDTARLPADLARLRLAAATRPGMQEAFSTMFPAPRQAAVDALAVDEDLVRDLDHPTLIVHGRDDRVIPLRSSLRLHELIDDSQLHVFGRCGHWAQIEHADSFNRLVADFLA